MAGRRFVLPLFSRATPLGSLQLVLLGTVNLIAIITLRRIVEVQDHLRVPTASLQQQQQQQQQQVAPALSQASSRREAQEGPEQEQSRARGSLLPVANRGEIPALLQREQLRVGAELGVQFGDYAAHTLGVWTSCERYYLVDCWGHQDNYHDVANVDDQEQERRYQRAKETLKPWDDKTVFLRMYTTDAATEIPDDSLDYIYVDARHDYCGVMEDLVTYWPKLRRGGILAGHDYVEAEEPQVVGLNQDWSLCLNGTRHEGAVKGAVNDFARQHGLSVVVTYREPDWPSWMARKP